MRLLQAVPAPSKAVDGNPSEHSGYRTGGLITTFNKVLVVSTEYLRLDRELVRMGYKSMKRVSTV